MVGINSNFNQYILNPYLTTKKEPKAEEKATETSIQDVKNENTDKTNSSNNVSSDVVLEKLRTSLNEINNSERTITDEKGNTLVYRNGELYKKIYTNGRYRIYEHDRSGKLTSSKTYRKDGSLYSEETYSDSAHKLFNDKSRKLYETRTFYDKNGNKTQTKTYDFKENESGKIVRTITSDKNPNEAKVVTMDKDKNIQSKAIVTKDASGKIIKKTLDSDADGTVDKTYEYTYSKNGKVTQTKVTTAKGNVYYYEKGKLTKAEFINGRYRIYEHDANGKLTSSKTYRKDGSLYSEETYSDSAHKLFNDKKNKVYSSRTFYDEKGNKTETKTYDYKENSNGDIVKTEKSDKKPYKTKIISTMDTDANIKAQTFTTIEDNGNERIEGYENGRIVTALTKTEKGTEREYYQYNDDGSFSVTYSTFTNKNNKDNDMTSSETLYYDKNGKLTQKVVYSNYKTQEDNNYKPNGRIIDIKLPTTKTIYTYDDNGNEKDITKETYVYNLDDGTKNITRYEGKRDETTGKITFKETETKEDVNLRHDHNPNDVTADDIINKAKEYLGYSTQDENRYLFGTYGDWCSGFASYVLLGLGIDLSEVGNRFLSSSMYNLAVKEGRFTDTTSVKDQETADKLRGQCIIFGKNKTDDNSRKISTREHIGIVENVTYNNDGTMTITTIEGNTGNKPNEVKNKTYTINSDGKILPNGRYIIGFADFISE